MKEIIRGSLVLVAILLGFPSDSAPQSSASQRGGWVTLGMGGSVVDGYLELVSPVELALQRGSTVWALRFLVDLMPGSEVGITERVGLLYGRAKWLGKERVSISSGLSLVSISFPSEPGPQGTGSGTTGLHKTVIGVPVVAEASFEPSRSLGAGVQAFGNLNTAKSYLGVALVVKVGSLH